MREFSYVYNQEWSRQSLDYWWGLGRTKNEFQGKQSSEEGPAWEKKIRKECSIP